MRDKKGITLISLVVYIIGMVVIISIVGSLLSFYNNNMVKINDTSDVNMELSKFSARMIAETKEAGNEIAEITGSTIRFKNGNVYTYQDNRIYENTMVVSQYVKDYLASLETNGDKQILRIYIVLQKGETEVVENLSYVIEKKNQQSTFGATYVHSASPRLGDYVEYVSETVTDNTTLTTDITGYASVQEVHTESLKWRILNINSDNTIDLICTTYTNLAVQFGDANGYNNAVWAMDTLCSNLYANNQYAISARNLKIEDIQDKMKNKVWNEYSSLVRYGATYEYATTKKYPNKWRNEQYAIIDGISQNGEMKQSEAGEIVTGFSEAEKSITITQTYWTYTPTENDFIDSTYYDLFINVGGNSAMWLASRYTNVGTEGANFGLYVLADKVIRGCGLYHSSGGNSTFSCKLRPIVTVNANLLDMGGKIYHNTPENAWQIKSE